MTLTTPKAPSVIVNTSPLLYLHQVNQMDRLEHHRTSIKTFLQQYAETWTQHPEPEVEIQLIFDEQHDRYLLLDVGWRGSQRIHHCIFHFDLKDGKNLAPRE